MKFYHRHSQYEIQSLIQQTKINGIKNDDKNY